jgi:hypothetical protein
MLFEGLSRITSNYVPWCTVYEGSLGKRVRRSIDYDALHACLGFSCGLTSRRFYEVNESVLRSRVHYQLVSCSLFPLIPCKLYFAALLPLFSAADVTLRSRQKMLS